MLLEHCQGWRALLWTAIAHPLWRSPYSPCHQVATTLASIYFSGQMWKTTSLLSAYPRCHRSAGAWSSPLWCHSTSGTIHRPEDLHPSGWAQWVTTKCCLTSESLSSLHVSHHAIHICFLVESESVLRLTNEPQFAGVNPVLHPICVAICHSLLQRHPEDGSRPDGQRPKREYYGSGSWFVLPTRYNLSD